tara:strand:- start:496 stop:939 length:444 start_codon:yes stop_codon:yes gene_type:complete
MAHIRQQIRDRIIADVTGLATTGANVYDSKLYNILQGELPALAVYTQNETSEISTIAPNVTLDRELEVIIECYAEANQNIENTLDTIAGEVENSLGTDLTLNNLCITQFLSSTDIDFTSEGEKPLGICKLTYNVRYMNTVTNSSTPL